MSDHAATTGDPDVRTDHDPHAGSPVSRHRRDVVRRLLDLGMSTQTLTAVLPEWSDTILGATTEG